MKATYDKNDLKSVLEFMRDELGIEAFRDAEKMYGLIYDLSPKFSAEGEILRQLSEKGLLSELEQAADSQNELDINRTLMKIRYQLTQKMFIRKKKVAFFIDALEILYGLKTLPKSVPKSQQLWEPLTKLVYIILFITVILLMIFTQFGYGKFGFNNNIHWYLHDNGTLKVSGSGNMPDNVQWGVPIQNVTSIVIAQNITGIGYRAFSSFTNLEEVNIPNSVTYIEDSAFSGCTNLKEVTIPEKVTYIGEYAFFGCDLRNLKIPNKVTYIGECAFGDCRNLKSVDIPAKAKIADDAFPGWTTVTRRES